MSLIDNLQNYRHTIDECQDYIDYAHQRYASGRYKLKNNLRIFISESSFLKMFIAWERFLESCFIDYLMDEPSIQNNRPAKFANPINVQHAQELLKGTKTIRNEK